ALQADAGLFLVVHAREQRIARALHVAIARLDGESPREPVVGGDAIGSDTIARHVQRAKLCGCFWIVALCGLQQQADRATALARCTASVEVTLRLHEQRVALAQRWR